MVLHSLAGYNSIPGSIRPLKNEIHQLIRLRWNTLVATSDISLPGPVQIEVVRRLVTFFYGGLNDCFTFNFVGG